MKRLIAITLAVIFCVTLFSPAISARQWDPNKPRPWIYSGPDNSGDDGGWQDGMSSPSPGAWGWMDFLSFKYLELFITPDKPNNKTQTDKPIQYDSGIHTEAGQSQGSASK